MDTLGEQCQDKIIRVHAVVNTLHIRHLGPITTLSVLTSLHVFEHIYYWRTHTQRTMLADHIKFPSLRSSKAKD